MTAALAFERDSDIADWAEVTEEVRLCSWGETSEQEDDVVPINRPLVERAILDAIDESRSILKLGQNWDGEGADGYSVHTWERATNFLRIFARSTFEAIGSVPAAPWITAAENGSIDLFWRANSKTLLINFPADASVPPSYYGETVEGDTIGGLIGASARRIDLAVWLNQPT